MMKKTRHTTEQISRILRETEAGRLTTDEVCRRRNISGQTYYRWRSKDGSIKVKEARILMELENENTELKKLLAEQFLKTKALEIAWGKRSKPGATAWCCQKMYGNPCCVTGEPYADGWD